jgi:hypothetical protein
MTPGNQLLVWSKIQGEGGEPLTAILARKEAERLAGNGAFWWGVGSNVVGTITSAGQQFGTLPILFSQMLGRPHVKDTNPGEVYLWTHYWSDQLRRSEPLPNHVLVTSRGGSKKTSHYALVCQRDNPIALGCEPFEPNDCRNHPSGGQPGASQVTSLLIVPQADASNGGRYREGFRARLVQPWMVILNRYRSLTPPEREKIANWRTIGWHVLVDELRRPPSLS